MITLFDKYSHPSIHGYLTDDELLLLMSQLCDMCNASNILGSCFTTSRTTASTAWYTCSLMAIERGLDYPSY